MEKLWYAFRWLVVISITSILGFLIGAGGMKIILFFYPLKNTSLNQKVLDTFQINTTPLPTQDPNLKNAVENSLAGTHGIYSVYFKNLSTGQIYTRNETREFETASLYKLWIMAVVYSQIEEGKIKKSDILKEDVTTLNNKFKIASDSAEKKEGTITSSVEDALFQMITVSDNYAALLLTEKIRLSSVSQFLQQHGLHSSRVGLHGENPASSAHDMGAFLDELYAGKLGSAESTREMLTLLKKQQLNEKIPKYLPSGTVVAHKTGELEGFSHDAGIVYTPNGNYILVLLSESTNREQANERLADLSQAIYNFIK